MKYEIVINGTSYEWPVIRRVCINSLIVALNRHNTIQPKCKLDPKPVDDGPKFRMMSI